MPGADSAVRSSQEAREAIPACHAMPQYRLIATNDRAKALIGPHGCDIVLYGDTRIGRGVAGPQTFTLPVDWLQFSTRHCRVYSADVS